MDDADDPYEILGLARDAGGDDIKRAYRRLALRHHPDLAREPGAAQRFQAIQEAYEALSDPVRRAEIDRGAGGGRGAWGFGGGAGGGSGGQGGSSGRGARGGPPRDRDDTLADTVEALRDLLSVLGLGAGQALERLLDALPEGAREAVLDVIGPWPTAGLPEEEADFGRRPLRVKGGGEFELDVLLSAREAAEGGAVPFRYHLGARFIDETLRIPPGTRHGQRHAYRIDVDDDVTLRVTVCVAVRA